jgi:uncharacterized membrane protein (UPF0127 family)
MNLMNKLKIFVFLMLLFSAIFVFVYSDFFNIYNKNDKIGEFAIITFYPDNSIPFVINCEVASSQEERTLGLMFRSNLSDDEGMLFVYENPQIVSFWMKNTLIPLDIIFLDENFSIINVEEADVELNISDENLTFYFSDRPAKWVVEINQGLCFKHNIKIGTKCFIEYL